MIIKEIKIGELPGFIESDEYKRLDIKPITELRAISQFNNPDARPDDIVLIYAANNNELLGFAGLLPRYINGEKTRIFSNTCWWAHPQKAKGVAIPLLFKVVERSGYSLFLSESPLKLKPILEKTGLFGTIHTNTGIRGFMRFYFADIFAKRFINYNWMLPFVRAFDSVLNMVFYPFKWFYSQKYKNTDYTIESVSAFDEKLTSFIKEHSTKELVEKTEASFYWYKNYPWIKKSTQKDSVQYPFTHVVNKFELEYFILKKEDEIKAFVAISNCNNLSKIPYIYFNKEEIKEIFYSVMKLILNKRYDSLVVFHPEIVELMNKIKMPFFYRKTVTKCSGTTKQISEYYKNMPLIQDGDGDAIFT